MTRVPDADLARRHVDGDPQAFGTLVDRYQNQLLAFFTRVAGSQRRAEALAVEAFVRAFRYLDQFDPTTRFSTWLHAIASNVAENDQSKRRRRAARARWVTAMAQQIRKRLQRRRGPLSRGNDRRVVSRRGAIERRRTQAAVTSSPQS